MERERCTYVYPRSWSRQPRARCRPSSAPLTSRSESSLPHMLSVRAAMARSANSHVYMYIYMYT